MSSNNEGFNLVSTIKEFTAGTIAGWAQVLFGQPFDIAKVRLQTQDLKNPRYNGFVDCVLKIMREEGPMAFYKGTLSPLLGVGAAVSVQFGVNGMTKRLFKSYVPDDGQDRLPMPLVFVSGAIAGFFQTFVTGPVEHIRIRMQAQGNDNRIYTGSIDAAKKIYSKHGLPGIYKGLVASLFRETPAFAFYFGVYELIIRRMTPVGKTVKDLSIFTLLFAGGMAGYAFWITSYQFDVLKSKIQTDSFEKPRYKNFRDCFYQTKAEGIGAFYRGFVPCMARAFPVNAVTFAVFEASMNILGRENKH